jgi:decaprenylphospho-beta-D-ribofuranose 2-oxidase
VSAQQISGWGRYPRASCDLLFTHSQEALSRRLPRLEGYIARGHGRSYGDAAIGERATIATSLLDRILAFDPVTGRIVLEAGVLLDDLLSFCVPRAFFPPVVPGTKQVTVGGMVASDVHGKNHHQRGGFGAHVEWLTLALPDGQVVECSPDVNPALFQATVGGMGLTGTILQVQLTLQPIETGWLREETIVAENLEAALDLLEQNDATYSVAWIDCLSRGRALGRSLLYCAEHASRACIGELEPFPAPRRGLLSVPFVLPGAPLNRYSVGAFNALYFRRGAARAGKSRLVDWDGFFFPLDRIGSWNRLYGSRGFLQYQVVVPASARWFLHELLQGLSARGSPSFLAVLKRLGAGSGLLSFPMPGFTLAVDLPVSPAALQLLDGFDARLRECGGRIYLAKDCRQSRETLSAGYPQLAGFAQVRRETGAKARVSSLLSQRLGL